MKRLTRRAPMLSRERLVNPHETDYAARVRDAGATDLRENFRVVQLPGGYSRVVALDPNRKAEK